MKSDNPPPRYDQRLSLQLDKAITALEEAEENGDMTRAKYAREWKRRLEREIGGRTR